MREYGQKERDREKLVEFRQRERRERETCGRKGNSVRHGDHTEEYLHL